jgi:hypothetical protein
MNRIQAPNGWTDTAHVTALNDEAMDDTRGGSSWSWQDFVSGLNWAIGAGCYLSQHPALCAGTVITGAVGLYLF